VRRYSWSTAFLALAAAVPIALVVTWMNANDSSDVVPTAGPAVGVNGLLCPHALSFVSDRSGRKQIYALDVRRPDEVLQVTRLEGHVFDTTWSPDARRLAFRWFRPDSSVGVYVSNADGTGIELVASGGVTPAWSPDGRHIAHAGPNGLSIVDVEKALSRDPSASRTVTRTDPRRPHEYPQWSPDGRRLVFSGYANNGSYDIWIIDADGGGLRDITPRPSLDYGAAWTPDGERIVFGSSGEGLGEANQLFIMDDDGSNIEPVGPGAGAVWSPDGRWIAYGLTEGGNTDVYIMRPDGSDSVRLTSDAAWDGYPTWVGDC
jgi:Tol biopolymer transport system component